MRDRDFELALVISGVYGQEKGRQLPILRRLPPDEFRDNQGCLPCAGRERCSRQSSKYFATIDLLPGYWQLGMTQRACERSAFCTRRGLYQFTRMPFGLSNAPASFCRLMQIILHNLLYVCCICYLDDIIVFGETP